MDNFTPADVAALTRDDSTFGGGAWWVVLLFVLLLGGGTFGFGSRAQASDLGQYATAASQQEILFGQRFNAIEGKMDSVANGICDSTFALNNAVGAVGTQVLDAKYDNALRIDDVKSKLQDCCCTTQRGIDSVNANLVAQSAAIQANDTANTQKVLDALCQGRIEALQSRVNSLELDRALGNVVRYPTATTYTAGTGPYCNGGQCGC